MFTLNCKGQLLIVDKPLVMGIINVTPDSFYEKSRSPVTEAALAQAEKFVHESVDIVDIGGQSTRPGSEPLDAEEELARVLPVITAIHQQYPDLIISIDTYFALVAKTAVEAGASIVNDISAGRFDPAMLPTVAGLGVPYILMHMKGTPRDMQQQAHFTDLTMEVLDFFTTQINKLEKMGIMDIIIDPGFGFAKTAEQNFALLHDLPVFSMLKRPVLMGISRKSTVYKTLGVSPEDALNGTTVLNTIGLMNGASLLRVHDVKAAKEAVILWNAVHEKTR
ncbi:MAG: dihydropteroate synthase [Terrimonas sp.]|nr:dihydropteroate synthase [Terrimonas sp.]